MTQFLSVDSYSHFAQSVRRKWRFSRDEIQDAFLAALRESSTTRHEIVAAGAKLFRAQRGCDWEDVSPQGAGGGPLGLSPSRMKPVVGRAREGRANPKGVDCLYLATHLQTAAAEVRPWVGTYVSVAVLETVRPLKLMSCTSDDLKRKIYFEAPDAAERERACWADVDRAFARPVDRDDELADYAPTQIIAELFRKEGFDGVGYRSSLGPGHNLAIFDLDAFKVVNCAPFYVSRIEHIIEQAGNAYFVSAKERLAKP